MFDYLQKYQKVPTEIKAKLDTAEVHEIIRRLEEKYRISLSVTLIKIIVKDIRLSDLTFYLIDKNGLDKETAQKLVAEIQVNILSRVQDYLSKPLSEPVNIEKVINNYSVEKTSIPPETNNHSSDDLELSLNKLVSHQSFLKKPIELSRWRQVAKTFLLGVRNQKALTDFLTKPFVEGGLGLSSQQSEELINSLLTIKQNLDQQARQQINIQPPNNSIDQLINQAATQDFESDLLVSLKKIDQKPRLDLNTETELPAGNLNEPKLLAPIEDVKPEIKDPANNQPPLIETKEVIEETKKEENKKIEPAALKSTNPTMVSPLDQRATDTKTGKIRMDDVRFEPKTLTPIDELATIGLRKFRYLGANADERAKKIKEKIDLLAEYGYGKKLQGIDAWRHSPLNMLYLKIGQLSIASEQTAEQILNEQVNHSQEENLTFDEFKAIMNLNKQIRF